MCLLAGALASLPYFFEYLFIFTFAGYFLLFLAVLRERRRENKIFRLFFCYFIGFYVPLYSFLSELYPFDRFGFTEGQAVFVVICACLLIPLLHSAIMSCVMLLSKLCRNGYFEIPLFASLFTVGEWLLSLGGLAFPWGSTAVSLTGFLPFVEPVSIFGQYFITFIVVGACVMFAKAIVDSGKMFALFAAMILLVNTASGTLILLMPRDGETTAKAALIQGDVLSNEKWDSSKYQEIFDKYISMTETAAQNGAKLILLPESAIPSTFTPGCQVHNAVADICVRYGVTVIMGVHAYSNGSNYNSVIAVYPDGTLSDRYDKRHLVPFGEYIPFSELLSDLFPFVASLSSDGSELTEGTDPVLIDSEYGKLGCLVCFDSIFPSFSRESVSEGAELLVIVTNDSWFNDSQGIYTHLRHAKIRAIETGRTVMRAANTGISAFIDECGSVVSSTSPLDEEILYASVTFSSVETPYVQTGDLILYAAMLLILTNIVIYIIRRIKNGKNQTV